MSDDAIISPDTRRTPRLPPGQRVTHDWPEMTAGPVPAFDPLAWDLSVFPVPLVDHVVSFDWPRFLALPRVKVFADLHCVTGWSKPDNLWEGVPTRELLTHVTPAAAARFVMVHGEYGFSANLSVEDFFAPDCLFAVRHNGKELSAEHGHPVRLVVPRLYAWKGVKWVRGVEFLEADRPGYWEDRRNGGYHMRGDPWAEERRAGAGAS